MEECVLNTPGWFVQTADRRLHAYYTLHVLLCDLALNPNEQVTILELSPSGGVVTYVPVTPESLRQKGAA